MKYKAVLFDMDGTILDTLEDLADAVNHMLAELNQPQVSLDTVRAGLGNGAAKLTYHCLPENAKDLSEKAYEEFKAYYNSHNNGKTKPYDGIVSLMERLKDRGVKLAVVSNKMEESVKKLADQFFPEVFSAAAGDREGMPRKPAPDSALSAAKRLGVKAQDCLYVGDSEVDVQTGKNAGMDCVAVCWGFRSEEQLRAAGAVRLAHNMEELESFII